MHHLWMGCCQEVYQQTHPVLFSDRAIYVVLYSLRTEVNMVDLHRHLMNVTIRCKEAPIILVGTHSDSMGGNPNLPLPALRARYPQVLDTYLTCCYLRLLSRCPYSTLGLLLPCVQIINTTDLRLSSTSPAGEGIADFAQLVAATAMDMPHVNQRIPKSYVDLGTDLQSWARQLLEVGKPPVSTRSDVFSRAQESALLSRRLTDLGVIHRALDFLAGGGAVVLARDGKTVILDPGWLADTLACAITADPARLSELPPALTQRGVLRYDAAHGTTLAAVWPDSKGYMDSLRRTLLGSLHRFDLAYEVLDGVGGDVMYSLVPCMLPRDESLGSTPLDDTIGLLASGQSEVGVQYLVELVPPDMWSSLILECRVMVIPETCTRTSAVLQWGSQRGILSLDLAKGRLTLVCRGPAPMELRVRFHWALVELVGHKYPFLAKNRWLHAMCHVCHEPSPVFGAVLNELVDEANPLRCIICRTDLCVDDLIVQPADALDKALLTPLVSIEGAALICSLVARVVDTTTDMCDRHGHRAQLWLPVLEHAGGAFAGVGVGAGSGAAEGTSELSAIGGRRVGWVSVCEDPSGWHVASDPVFPKELVASAALPSVLPVLQRVATVVLAVAGVTRSSSLAPAEWRDWDASLLPHVLATTRDGRTNWVEFTHGLGHTTALHGRCGSWACPRHIDITKVTASDVSLSCSSVSPPPRPGERGGVGGVAG
jgi:hypothetical protein